MKKIKVYASPHIVMKDQDECDIVYDLWRLLDKMSSFPFDLKEAYFLLAFKAGDKDLDNIGLTIPYVEKE